MTVEELHKALGAMVEQGHGDAEVMHVNGQGKAQAVLGWELVTSMAYTGRQSHDPKKALKFNCLSRF